VNARHPYLSAVAIAIAALSATGCGGGDDTTASAQPTRLSAGRMHSLIAVEPPPPEEPPSTCSAPSEPVITSFGFGDEVGGNPGTPGDPVALQTGVAATVTFTDADAADTHTVNWDWGDGSVLAAMPVELEVNGAGHSSATHSYAEPGVYTVTATIKDACATTVASRLVVVYDPTAGFVTGGGWIDSPARAYVAAPTLSGRANFGFVSKYLKGATTPIGQTEFQFQTANLNFHSEHYEWLVVSGARAQFKGTGTINGASDFKFLLTAIDGQLLGAGKGSDRFRIKIWHTDGSGKDLVDYDNDASATGTSDDGTALGGGSIVIHK